MTTTQQDTTTVRLPRSLVEQLRPIAAAHERSLAAELRVVLTTYIQHEQADGETGKGSGGSTRTMVPKGRVPGMPIRGLGEGGRFGQGGKW
ncbi:MAG: Arc family DNA-binding protein [Solirubrobacteraceae bacterium]